MMLRVIAATLKALILRRLPAPILHAIESFNMTIIQIFYVAFFIVCFTCLRFGIPALLFWAVGRVAERHALQGPRIPISG
jgi:hypothetical protein